MRHDLKLEDLVSGEEMSIASLGGRPMIVDFWATWCVPCIARKGTIKKIQEKYGDQLGYIGVWVADKNRERALGVIERNALSYPSLHDREDQYMRLFEFVYLPKTLIISPSFEIIAIIEAYSGPEEKYKFIETIESVV